MISKGAVIALLCSFVSAQGIRGFNSGASSVDGAAKTQDDFEAEFRTAQNLQGARGVFTSARLYTTIQGNTVNTPISAIPAAISTGTQLLLGLWASGGQELFNDELIALRQAISEYGSDFTDLVVGISVGSEDLYRVSPTGIQNDAGVGAGPQVIAGYMQQVKQAIRGTSLGGTPVGHVDTYTAWINGSNSAVIQASDFLGMNAFPYYQFEVSNSINNAKDLYFSAYDQTVDAANGKPVWLTETGWPDSGPTVGDAVASVANARTYWQQVYCTVPSNVNLFWYTLRDANAANDATFGVAGSQPDSSTVYSLACRRSSNSQDNAEDDNGSDNGNNNGNTENSSSPSPTPIPLPRPIPSPKPSGSATYSILPIDPITTTQLPAPTNAPPANTTAPQPAPTTTTPPPFDPDNGAPTLSGNIFNGLVVATSLWIVGACFAHY